MISNIASDIVVLISLSIEKIVILYNQMFFRINKTR